MTKKDRQRFNREFKLEAVRLVNHSEKKATEVARELGISVQILYKWQDEVKKRGASAFPGYGHRSQIQQNNNDNNAELMRLRKENSRLREERDILKKATAFFTREN